TPVLDASPDASISSRRPRRPPIWEERMSLGYSVQAVPVVLCGAGILIACVRPAELRSPPCPQVAAESFDTARIDSLFAASSRDPMRDLKGVVIRRHGCTLAERYFNGDDAASLHDIRSATKSITSTLVGIAIQQGLIKGVDEAVSGLLPDGMLSAEQRFRLRDVLTMRSGLDSDDRDSL